MLLSEAFVSKRNNFNAVRLLAACAVVVSHAVFIRTGIESSEPLISSTGMSLGAHAVNIFFGISGFLILASWERHPSPLRFATARLLRIMPALIIAACIMAVAGMWLTQLPVHTYLGGHDVLQFVLKASSFNARASLPAVFTETVPNDVVFMTIWTLKYELAAYVCVLTAGLLGLTRHTTFHVTALGLCILATLLISAVPSIAESHVVVAHFARFGLCFVIGMCAWQFRSQIPLTLPLFAGAVALLVVSYLSGPLHQALMYPAEIYAALWLALSPRLLIPAWITQIDLSYGIYLYGWPTSQILRTVWPDIGILMLAGGSVVLAAGIAMLSWYIIEKPAIQVLPTLVEKLRTLAPSISVSSAGRPSN